MGRGAGARVEVGAECLAFDDGDQLEHLLAVQSAQRSLPGLGDVDLQPGAERGQSGGEEARLAVELAYSPALVGDLLHPQDFEALDLSVLDRERDDVGRHGDQYEGSPFACLIHGCGCGGLRRVPGGPLPDDAAGLRAASARLRVVAGAKAAQVLPVPWLEAGRPVWQDGRKDRPGSFPAPAARAEPDGGAMPVFAVTTAKGPNWDHARGIREQPFWDQHAAFADELAGRGVIILGGPVASDNEEDIALLAVQAPSEEALRSVFAADPWAVHEVFRIKDVRVWTLWLDGRSRQAPAAEIPRHPQYRA